MTRTESGLRVDVLVVGGGPAGIAAASRAAEAGAGVAIIDAGLRPGGQIWRHADTRSLPRTATQWIERSRRAGVHWMPQSTVIDGSLATGLVVVSRSGGTRIVHAGRVIVATGARELLLPYPGWTLPNVMGVGGVQALVKGGLDVRGKRAIVAGSGPLLLPVAAALAAAGARVSHVLEQAPTSSLAGFVLSLLRQPAKLLLAARYRAAIPLRAYHAGVWVERATGAQRVESVTLTDGRTRWSEECDLLCCSYGLVPGTELARLLGCTIIDGKVAVDDRQQTSVPGVYCAGESTGIAGDAAAIAEGEVAGLAAFMPDDHPIPATVVRARNDGRVFERRLRTTFRLRPEVLALADDDTIICRCEDVRLGVLDRTWTGRQAKLYTRVGMGACQGAVCGPILQQLHGWSPGTGRPPLHAPLLGEWNVDPSRASTGPATT